VELRFPNLIKELKSVKSEKEVFDRSIHQLQELTNFFLNQIEYEDAMVFLENTLHQMQIKKWGGDSESQPEGDMSKKMKLIKFKPTHSAFRHLQEAYVDSRAHLQAQIVQQQTRLEAIQADLRREQEQFEEMANNFLAKDGRIVEKVAQAQAASGQLAGAATATRKADVMKMF